ncbi:MAG: SoxR reducing system RseC family protein [candidate division WOR-3 bacterium]|nr:SoxR reducing system RseC family protein [candidate division WOR-3 bacterium]MCX7837387.1 SoxR reducing system RseC family protein [candidate division WOR-3 bacterium]MDW8114316.1 SoxR reducing system RseC family protein [candidate division WOR-3 bacterium]
MDCFYGYIKEIKGNRAVVKVSINPKCFGCGEKGGCGIFVKREERELEVFNPINAQVGDLVMIDYPEKRVWLFLFLFGLPISGILFGLYLGFYIFKKEIYALFFSFLFLFLILIFLKIFQNLLLKKEKFLPKIKEIIKEEK